ncbi:MAG: hypothetical protein ACRDLR_05140, partial [Gaiellaceae bacterium]
LALMATSVLAITTTALILSSTANERGAYSSSQGRQAFLLAQTALAYAEGDVYSSGQTGVTPPTGTQDLPAQPGGGSGTYSMSLESDSATWDLSGTGTVGGASKTVYAHAYVPSGNAAASYQLWNYLYADDTSGQSTGSCETTINGGTTVSVPIYVRDNLCINGGASFTGSSLTVDGTLTVNGGGSVGTKKKPIQSVAIGGTPSSSACTNGYNGAVTPGTSYCDGKHASLYASSVSTSVPSNDGMPTVDFQAAYNTQQNTTQTGCPSGLFDNNTTFDNSLSNAATKLFEYQYYPGPLSYDCWVGSNELKWQQTSGSSSGTLYVNGTFYFDGSMSLGGGQKIVYSGKGTLYFSGSVSISGGSSFCGIANCTANWNTTDNAVILVAQCWANSTGSSLVNSGCIHISGGADAQVGAYATTNYAIDGGASNMGPVVSDTLSVSGGSSTLIPFDQDNMPLGTPETASTPADPPSNWSG